MKKTKKAAPVKSPKAAPRQRITTQVVCRPAEIIIDLDMALLAAAAPRLTIKDMTVIAMAIGGRLIVPPPGSDRHHGGFVKWQMVIEVLQ